MIAVDTNILVRMLVEDDNAQTKTIQDAFRLAEAYSIQIIVLPEVLIETVWVLESVYNCERKEIARFLDKLEHTTSITLTDPQVTRNVIEQYKTKGDFADLMIVHQAKSRKAIRLFSFDSDLRKAFPGYVVNKLSEEELQSLI